MRKSPSSQSGTSSQLTWHATRASGTGRIEYPPRPCGPSRSGCSRRRRRPRALLLPPLRGRHPLAAPLDLARQRQAAARTVVKSHAGGCDHDVHLARAHVRGKPASPCSRSTSPASRATRRTWSHGGIRHRVDVDAQLVRVIEVRAPHRVRVPVNVAERDRPQQVRGVDRHELLRLAPGRELQHRRLQPLRPLRRHALLVDRLRLDPAGEALEHRRALADVVEDRVGAFDVVAGEVALRPAGPGEVDLAGVRELDLVPVQLEDLVSVGTRRSVTRCRRGRPRAPGARRARLVQGHVPGGPGRGAIGRGLERAGLMPPDLCRSPTAARARSTRCSSTSAARRSAKVQRPARPRDRGGYGLVEDGGTAMVEMAAACGLRSSPRTSATPGPQAPTGPAS